MSEIPMFGPERPQYHHKIVYLADTERKMARIATRFNNPTADYNLAHLGLLGLGPDGDVRCLISTDDGDFLIKRGHIIDVQGSLRGHRYKSKPLTAEDINDLPLSINESLQIGSWQLPPVRSFLLDSQMHMPIVQPQEPDVFAEIETKLDDRYSLRPKRAQFLGALAVDDPTSPTYVRRRPVDTLGPNAVVGYLS